MKWICSGINSPRCMKKFFVFGKRFLILLFIGLAFSYLPGAVIAQAGTITVNTLLDGGVIGDNILTLREAIQIATGAVAFPGAFSAAEQAQVVGAVGNAVADTVQFANALLTSNDNDGDGVVEPISIFLGGDDFNTDGVLDFADKILVVTAALPALNGAAGDTINGDINGDGIPDIEVRGGLGFTIFSITSANQTIRNLAITGGAAGISITGTGSTGVSITGNFIGLELNGAGRGSIVGINVGFGVPDTTIGGTTATDRNIISSQQFGVGIALAGTDTRVIGNFIGTNIAGTAPLGNFIGIDFNSGCNRCVVGGTNPGEGNVISGNFLGIDLEGINSRVIGNLIGTDVTGTRFLGNDTGIEFFLVCFNCIVGGTNPGERNVISGNTLGVDLNHSSSRLIGNFIGTDINGTNPLGNTTGVTIDPNCDGCVIGGTNPGERNIISGNGTGIDLEGVNSRVVGNFIGTDVTGLLFLGNSTGVNVGANCNNCTVGGGNVISGNTFRGVDLDGLNSRVTGNFIGTDAAGTGDLGNLAGIFANASCRNCGIGGLTVAERNIISGNDGDGINIAASFSQIFGNFIGTDSTGSNPLGNSGAGIRLSGDDNAVGDPLNQAAARNIIAFNAGGGVVVTGSLRNTISGNSLFNNQGLGIDLGDDGVTLNDSTDADTGPNELLNFPEFDAISFTLVGGTATVTGRAPAGSRVEIFLSALDPSGHGEGRTFLTAVTATITGTFSVVLAGRSDRELITATATDASGNTSEFSPNSMLGFGPAEWGLSGDIPVPGDYNGDGATDFAVWRPVDPTAVPPFAGKWYILNFFFGFSLETWGLLGDIPVPADYDGDGLTDIAVWRPTEGNWYIRPSSVPGSFDVRLWGILGDIPVPADYDGDGRDDLAVWRPSTGGWFVILSGGGFIFDVRFGQNGDTPIPGDYDGDGKADLAVFRVNEVFPDRTRWSFMLSTASGQRRTVVLNQFGNVPVPEDYNGDGKTDVAAWNPADGFWNVITVGFAILRINQQWGVFGDIPVPGDYDRDGRADFAVWRPSTGVWFILRSSDNSQQTIQFKQFLDQFLAQK